MKISLIVEYLNGRGGTARQALELGRQLLLSGHEVQIVTLVWDRQACFPELTASLPIKAVTEVHSCIQGRGWIQFLPAFVQKILRYGARLSGVSYLANYSLMRNSTLRLTALLRKAAKGSDILNPHDFGPAAWAAAEVGKELNIPVVWQCNDPFLRWDVSRLLARPIRNWIIQADQSRVLGIRHITTLDTRVARVVQQRYGCQSKVVRSGVDLKSFESLPDKSAARRALGLREKSRISLVLAFLNSPHRNVEDAIDSHALGPGDVILVLAAPAPNQNLSGYPARIASAISASPARERIVWLRQPLAGDNDLRNLFAASDIFVFPNVQQTWGLAVIEAAAAGLPVVISDAAGVSEVFQHTVNAMVYPGGDVTDLTRHLALLWNNQVMRNEIAVRGQEMVRTSFSWDKYASAMQEIFREVL